MIDTTYCGNCAYWDGHFDGRGVCRRHAPRPEQSKDGPAHRTHYTSWPSTDRDDSCAEGKQATRG